MEKILNSLYEKMKGINKYKEHFKNFKALRTDEERIIFTLNIMLEYDIIPQACGNIKDAKQSAILREKGNAMFLSKPMTSETCVSALTLYTKSIAYAPCSSEQLALSYANRAAVLMKFCKYEECVQDTDRALALPYPDNLKFKLYLRKAECIKALKNSGLEDTIKEAQQWLERISLDERLRKDINEKLVSIKRAPKSHKSKKRNVMKRKSECPLPKLQARSTEVPCATDAVAVDYNKHYGRHVVATRKINPGEIIAIEKPYSLILSRNNVDTHCSYCLEVSWANIPCDHCVHVMYCSEECKALDWKEFHDMECSVLPSLLQLDFTQFNLLGLRLATQAVKESSSFQELREELKKIDSWHDPRTRGFSENGTLEGDKYRSVLSFATNTEKRTPHDLFRKSIEACFSLYFLATCTNMFGSPFKELSALSNNADVSFVGGLILRHLQMIPCSVHSFMEECGIDSVERGIVVMPFTGLFSHSCVSNLTWQPWGKHMIVYAVLPIEKGDQLLCSYGYRFRVFPKSTRQEGLLNEYYFKCQCIACEEDWPMYQFLISFRELVKTKEDEKKISHVLRNLYRYLDLSFVGDIADKPYIVDDLLQMITVMYDLVPMPCEEMFTAVDLLRCVYSFFGNIREIPVLQAVHSP